MTLNTAATAALDRIRASVAYQQRVVYCFHAWMPFNNLGMAGFRFKSIQTPEIPGLDLIPLTITPDSHIESRIDERSPNLSSVPIVMPFDRPIEECYSDLVSKYGKYGFRRVGALDGDLNDMERTVQVFQQIFSGFIGHGRLEDLPAYLGVVSPFRDMLTAPVKPRIRTTYLQELEALLKAGKVSVAEYEKFIKAIPEFAESALSAHRQALSPGENGVLPRSIMWINAGEKKAFDDADNWLIRQFPGFDATTKQTVKSSDQDALTRLADMLADRLQPTAPPAEDPPVVPPPVVDPPADTAALQAAFEAEAEEEELTKELVTESIVGTSEPIQCEAITKAGARCKNTEHDPGTGACLSPAHQKQVANRRAAALEESDAEESQSSNGDGAGVDKNAVVSEVGG